MQNHLVSFHAILIAFLPHCGALFNATSRCSYNATLGSVDLDRPCQVAAPFVPVTAAEAPTACFFNRPGESRLLPLRELPESVVQGVLLEGVDPIGEMGPGDRWRVNVLLLSLRGA